MTDTKTLYAAYAEVIEQALAELVTDGTLPEGTSFKNVTLEPPRDPSHGDLATNAAMVLAKPAKTNPRALAEAIVGKLSGIGSRRGRTNVSGPGQNAAISFRARGDRVARSSARPGSRTWVINGL